MRDRTDLWIVSSFVWDHHHVGRDVRMCTDSRESFTLRVCALGGCLLSVAQECPHTDTHSPAYAIVNGQKDPMYHYDEGSW